MDKYNIAVARFKRIKKEINSSNDKMEGLLDSANAEIEKQKITITSLDTIIKGLETKLKETTDKVNILVSKEAVK